MLSFPERIVLELTSGCNLKCPVCPRQYLDIAEGYMEQGLWQRVIDEIFEEAPETVILPFWRGEALLHPQFCELLQYAVDKFMKVHISTNGHLVNDENASILLQCAFITFSIHTSKGYDSARKFLHRRKGNMPVVQISFVEEEATERILRQVLDCPDLDGFDNVRLYEEHSRNGIFGKSKSAVGGKREFCPKLKDTLVIACDGSISRCNHIWKPEEEMTVRSASIKEIWASKALMHIRMKYPDTLCMPCDQWRGHTRGEAWRLVGSQRLHEVFK